jgi:hypothetical protein
MVKVTVYLDETLWLRFRKACLDHKISASKALGPLVEQQIALWQVRPGPHQEKP